MKEKIYVFIKETAKNRDVLCDYFEIAKHVGTNDLSVHLKELEAEGRIKREIGEYVLEENR